VLLARSSPECLLYMRLHPCACGDVSVPPSQGIHAGPETLIARYGGPCPQCGRDRRFELALDPEPPPRSGYGGARPSTIICPGEFAVQSDRLAARWPADPSAIPPGDRAAARDDLAWAIHALEEVVKFLPADGDAVPASAFVSDAGRAAHATAPGRFSARRLRARLGAYRQILDDLDGVS
jgi:hypothetical protein